MREKQIEKVSQRLFIVTSILAVSLLLLSAWFILIYQLMCPLCEFLGRG